MDCWGIVETREFIMNIRRHHIAVIEQHDFEIRRNFVYVHNFPGFIRTIDTNTDHFGVDL